MLTSKYLLFVDQKLKPDQELLKKDLWYFIHCGKIYIT